MNRQGQSCSSTSRVFVHESLHDAVLDALVAEAEALPVGLPWEDGKEVGPIVSARQYERVTGFITSGREEGARLVAGGGGPGDPALANGFFVCPTVFDGVDDSMRIAREEIRSVVINMEHAAFDQGLANALAEHLKAPCYTLAELKAENLYQAVRAEMDKGP